MRRVTVAVTPPYDVAVGDGILEEVAVAVGARSRVAVVSPAPVGGPYAPSVVAALERGGREVECLPIPDGEAAKTLEEVGRLCRRFAAWGLRRGDAVVALGGGATGDTAGFAAAVYHRGVAIVQVPTTLLAMVDAAIGGKTAVNLPEGKNLVGAFHQPVGVVADVATLASLPEPDYRSGLGEVAKYALSPGGEAVAGLLARDPAAVLARDPGILTDLVAASAAMKAAVVARDPEERTGARAALNYGHTLAHALEANAGYELAHGQAVAIGLVFAIHLARELGRVDDAAVADVEATLRRLELPTTVPGGADAAGLRAAMGRDKKVRGTLTFVLPGADGLTLVDDPPARAVERALAAVGVGG